MSIICNIQMGCQIISIQNDNDNYVKHMWSSSGMAQSILKMFTCSLKIPISVKSYVKYIQDIYPKSSINYFLKCWEIIYIFHFLFLDKVASGNPSHLVPVHNMTSSWVVPVFQESHSPPTTNNYRTFENKVLCSCSKTFLQVLNAF